MDTDLTAENAKSAEIKNLLFEFFVVKIWKASVFMGYANRGM